ncbi:MAG: nitroreductase family protein [Candidatus Omnitrophota bacterium]|jgi:nitroreductase
MDALEAIKIRRSVRQFQNKPIPRDILETLVDAGRYAATARNVQPWEFLVITERETLKKIASLAENGRFIADTASCIAVYSNDTKYYLEDGCAATENILICAASLGIGSCWVAGDKKPYCPEVSYLLGVPIGYKLISLIALGYPTDKNALNVAEKRSLKESLHWEKF